jgi:hypothetical protein
MPTARKMARSVVEGQRMGANSRARSEPAHCKGGA